MKIQFLGTGGAFDVPYGNSSMLIELNGMRILVDCGHSVFPALVTKGLADQVDAVLLTHLHDDHVGSLSTLLFYFNLVLKKGRMPVIVPSAGFQDEVERFLSHAMGKPQERMAFVPVSEVPGIIAIDTFGQHVAGMQTWAYGFVEGEARMVYSGDNGQAAKLFDKLPGLGLKGATVFHEMTFYPGISAHAFYEDLVPYLADYEIYGYHCDPSLNPPQNPVPLVYHQARFMA